MAPSRNRSCCEPLLEELEPLAEEMVEETRREIPSFILVPRAEHLADTLASIEWLSHYTLDRPTSSRCRTPPGTRSPPRRAGGAGRGPAPRLAALGPDRDRAGATLAEELGLDAAVVIDVYEGALRAADEALVPLAGGHRDAREVKPRAAAARERFVIGALTGEFGAEQVRASAAAFGLDLTRSYRAVRALVAVSGNGAGPAPAAGLWRADAELPRGSRRRTRAS